MGKNLKHGVNDEISKQQQLTNGNKTEKQIIFSSKFLEKDKQKLKN